MSDKRIVVAHKYMPTVWPITFSIASWLLMDRLGIPGWAWGVYWTLLAIIWIALSVSLFTEEARNPFEDRP